MKKYPFFLFIYLFSGFWTRIYAQFDFSTVTTSPQCANTRTGKIEVIPTGANGPFTITLVKGNSSNGPAERLVTSSGSFVFDSLGAGSYQVFVSVNGQNCQSMQKRVQIVDPQDFYGAIYPIDSTCAPCDLILSANFLPDSNYSYLWSNNQTTPKITGVCDGFYTLNVTELSTGCQKEYSITATNVSPGFTIINFGSLCQDIEVSFFFEVESTNFGPCFEINQDSISWDFGDGSTSSDFNPTHKYTSSGTFTIQLTMNGGLYATTTVTVGSPSIDFSSSPDCSAPRRISFNPTNFCFSNFNYSWDFGDPTSPSNTSNEQNPTHDFSNAGNFTVTLTSGSQTSSNTVYVLDNPNQAPTISVIPNLCGSLPYNRRFSSYLQCAQSYLWDFGDPNSGIANTSSLVSPSHNFSGPGTYQVTLITDSGQFYGVFETIPLVIENPVSLPTSADGFLNFLGDTVSIGPAMESGFAYSWQNGQSISPLKVSQPGVYILTKSNPFNPNACFSFDTILVNYCGQFTSKNTETLATEFFSLYPNPVNDKLHFSSGIMGHYQIMNVCGQTFGEGNLTREIDVIKTEGMPNGLYFLRWRSDQGTSGSLKFLVDGK
jgi:PKD repeat protein